MWPQIPPAQQQKAEVRFPELPKAEKSHTWWWRCGAKITTLPNCLQAEWRLKSKGDTDYHLTESSSWCSTCLSRITIIRGDLAPLWDESSLLDQSHHLSSSCVCPHEPVLQFPQKRYANGNQLVAWLHPHGIVHPRPTLLSLSAKTYSENTGTGGWRHSGVLLGLLLCQLELHAGAADGKPSRQGWLLEPWCMRAGGSRPWAILSRSHVWPSVDPFCWLYKLYKHF